MKKLPSLKSFALYLIIILALAGTISGVWWFLTANSPLREGETKRGLNPPPREEGSGEVNPVQTYSAPEDPFTFQYPGKFTVTEVPIETGGKRLLVESSEPKRGFELTILPFDEEGPLTETRIKQDIPDLPMSNIQYLDFTPSPLQGEGGGEVGVSSVIPVIAFNSTDENIGATYEIWFVRGGYLYEALTYPEFAEGMQGILATWAFK